MTLSLSGVRVSAIALAFSVTVGPAAASASPPSNVIAIPPGQREPDERVVGPGELRDFRIGQPPAERSPSPEPRTTTPPAATAEPIPAPTRSTARPSVPATPSPDAPAAAAPGSGETSRSFEAPDRSAGGVTPAPSDRAASSSTNVATPTAIAPRAFPQDDAMSSDGTVGLTWWPWLLLLVAAAAGGAYWVRRRAAPALAGPAPVEERVRAPEPAPAPAPSRTAAPARPNPFDGLGPASAPRTPAAPVPTTVPPAAPASTGIVSTALRPKIEMRVVPVRAAIEADSVWLDYRLLLANTGSANAYDLRIDGALVNAGPDQDGAIEALFGAPRAGGDIPALRQLPPGQQVELQGRAQRSLSDMRVLQATDRQIIAPLLVLRLTRASRPGGQPMEVEIQRHFAGRVGAEDGRLAPWRIDRGPRMIRNPILKRA